jgi:hypothetical protein
LQKNRKMTLRCPKCHGYTRTDLAPELTGDKMCECLLAMDGPDADTGMGYSRPAHIWRVTVDDGIIAYTCEIAGSDRCSIMNVIDAATRELKGRRLREWHSDRIADPEQSHAT